MLSSYINVDHPSGLFPSGFPTKFVYAFHIFPMRGTRHAHLTILDLITLTISVEIYKL